MAYNFTEKLESFTTGKRVLLMLLVMKAKRNAQCTCK